MSDQVKEIQSLLAQYSDIQHSITVSQLAFQDAEAAIVPAEVQVQLADLKVEFLGRETTARGKMDLVKAQIVEKMKGLPEAQYKTIKEAGFMAVAKGGKKEEEVDADILFKGLQTLAHNYPAIAPEISNILDMAKVTKVTDRTVAVQIAK